MECIKLIINKDETGISIDDNHSVSEATRKKQQRAFRRVIELDKKKIKIVIDGNRQNIEQSTDKKGNFYKVYCDKEK